MRTKPHFPENGAQINRRVLLHLHEDGLLDILAAIIIAVFGLIPLLDGSGMETWLRQIIYLSIYALGVVLILWLKGRISLPRAGRVVLKKEKRRAGLIIFLAVNLGIFLGVLLLFIFRASVPDIMGNYQLSILLGMVFLMMYTTAGLLLKAVRFHIWGLLIMAAFLLGNFLSLSGKTGNHGIPLACFGSAAIIALWGIGLLIRFMKDHPLSGHDEGYQ